MAVATTPTTVPVGRITDGLCRRHIEQIARTGWPFTGPDTFDAHRECRDCLAAVNAYAPANGPTNGFWNLRACRDFSIHDYDAIKAIHEAGHAVIGLITGHPLLRVRIAAPGEKIGENAGGVVEWGPWEMDLLFHVAMVWAGEQANLRWLAEMGRDTTENRVDMAFLAGPDTVDAHGWAARRELPATFGRDYSQFLVNLYWGRICALADELRFRRDMTGAEVRSFLDM